MRRILSPLAPVGAISLAFVLATCGGAGGSPDVSLPPAASPAASAAAPSVAAPSPSASASPSAVSSPASSGAGVEIVGVEYAFENVPATTAAGTTFTFRNNGQELHEMVVVKKNEGVTESFEELLALPDDQAFAFITFAGQAMAEPGQTAEGSVTVADPGEYLMVCFVPTGMTELPEGSLGPDASLPAGAPHFTQGMLAEFTVE